jgi:hypothetical protein
MKFESIQIDLDLDEVFVPGRKFIPLRNGFGCIEAAPNFFLILKKEDKPCSLGRTWLVFREGKETEQSLIFGSDWFRSVAVVPSHLEEKDYQKYREWFVHAYCERQKSREMIDAIACLEKGL